MKDRRILIIAYSCEPKKGSESSVGWNWVKQITKYSQAWVITRTSNKKLIETALSEKDRKTVHFIYFDLPKWLRFWKKGEMSIRIYYLVWQFLVYFMSKRLIKKMRFDIVHHLTFSMDWMPAFASFLPTPFVWGPIGGSCKDFPVRFLREIGLRNCLYELFRCLFLFWNSQLDPLVNLSKKRANILLLSSKGDLNYYSEHLKKKIRLMLNIGISEDELPKIKIERSKDKFLIFSSGRLVHWKGHTISLKAFSKFAKEFPNAEFHIGGKGRELRRLKKLAKRLDLEEKVTFLDFLPSREDVLKKISESNVFLLPTLRDGPLVGLLEAIAVGTPIISTDIPGQADILTEECGISIKRDTPEQMINDIFIALKKLAQDENLRLKMGNAARERALSLLNWNRKGEFIKKIYKGIIENDHLISL